VLLHFFPTSHLPLFFLLPILSTRMACEKGLVLSKIIDFKSLPLLRNHNFRVDASPVSSLGTSLWAPGSIPLSDDPPPNPADCRPSSFRVSLLFLLVYQASVMTLVCTMIGFASLSFYLLLGSVPFLRAVLGTFFPLAPAGIRSTSAPLLPIASAPCPPHFFSLTTPRIISSSVIWLFLAKFTIYLGLSFVCSASSVLEYPSSHSSFPFYVPFLDASCPVTFTISVHVPL